MSDEKKKVDDESTKSGVSPAQVTAAALAAVTAAFLGSTLGVYGTVLGAGLISVVTTIGSELYMRSMERTKRAARVLSAAAPRRGGRHGATNSAADPDRTVYLTPPTREQLAEYTAARERTRVLASTGATEDARERHRWWRRRWPVVVATSALAFVVGMVVVTGYEGVTGKALSGDGPTTVGNIVRDGGSGAQRGPAPDTGEDEPVETESSTVPTSEQPDSGREEDGDRTERERETPTTEPTATSELDTPSEPSEPNEVPTDDPEPTEGSEPTQPEDGGDSDGGATRPNAW